MRKNYDYPKGPPCNKYKAIMLIRYLAKNYIINYFHDGKRKCKVIVFLKQLIMCLCTTYSLSLSSVIKNVCIIIRGAQNVFGVWRCGFGVHNAHSVTHYIVL